MSKGVKHKILEIKEKYNKTILIQPYIDKIATIDNSITENSKFDLRVMVLCDIKGNVYTDKNFIVRMTSDTYDSESKEKENYLTNYKFHKRDELIQNSEWLYKQWAKQYPEDEDEIFGIDDDGDDGDDDNNNNTILFNKIAEIIKYIYDKMKSKKYMDYVKDKSNKYFGIYGYDFIIGESRKVYFIEANLVPGNATKYMVELLHEQLAINFPKHFERQTEHFVRVM